MPPRRKGTPATHEQRPDGTATSVEDSRGTVKQNRGKRGGGKDNNRLGTGGVEVEEPQQETLVTGTSQASSRRRSNVPMLGRSAIVLPNTTLEAAQSSLKVKGGLNFPSAHSCSTLMATRSELKLDQALSSRTSSRHRKVVCYNEQSPSQLRNKIPPTASKLNTKAVARKESSALLLSVDVKSVKEDPTSSMVETLVPRTASKPKTKAPTKRESSALLLSVGAKRIKEDPTSSMVETLVPPTASKPKANTTAKRESSALLLSVDAKRIKEDPTSSMVEALVPPTASKPKAKAAAKRESSALLLSLDAERVKEGRTSSMVETLALRSEITSLVKRRRTRDQEMKLLPSHVDKDSAVFTTAATSHVKRGKTRAQGLESLQSYIDENTAGGMTSEQILLLPTRIKLPKEQIGDTVAKLEALEGKVSVTVTKQEKKSYTAGTTNAKAAPEYTGRNQGKKRFSKKVTGTPHNQEVIEESIGLESREVHATEGNAQNFSASAAVNEKSIRVHRLVDRSKIQITAVKKIKSCSRKAAMANAAQNAEVCLPDAFDGESKELCEIDQASDADKKMSFKAQKKGRKPESLKRALPEAQAGKEGNFTGIVIDHDLLLECKYAGKGDVEDFIIVDKNLQSQTQKKGRTVARMKTSFGVKGTEMENATVTDSADFEGCHNIKIDLKSPERAGVQVSTNVDKNLQCQTRAKRRKPVTRKGTLPATRADEIEKATVLGIPSVLESNDYSTTTDIKLEGVYSVSCHEDNNLCVETRQKEQKAVSRKRTLQGTFGNQEQHLETPLVQVGSVLQTENAHDATAMYGTAQTNGRSTKQRTRIGSTEHNKKLKTSGALPLSSPGPSLQKLVEEAEDAENQNCKKTVQGEVTQDWTATDLTNFGSRVEGSLEKKRKEEGKKKRAMKFDALPVGFGLGISCWSPSPLKCQGLEEETGLSVVEDSVIDNQVLSMSLGEAEKQPNLQVVAMLDNTRHILSSKQGLEAQPNNVKAIPTSPTALQESSISLDDAKYVQGIGLGSNPDKVVKFHSGKVGGRTRKTNTLQVALSQLVAKSIDENMLDEEKMESGSNGYQTNRQPNSGKGAATRSKRITRSTKQ